MTSRKRKGLRAKGKRYALLPEEVLFSTAYHAQPDWARTVLFALASRYHGHNNGDLSLPPAEAKERGVSAPWKLYAGLRLLEKADLILCTRRGRLERGTKLCSLYALTWREINEPNSATYDGNIRPSPMPSQWWARWEKPDDWADVVKQTARANHGKTKNPVARKKNPVSTTLGKGRSTTLGKGSPQNRSTTLGKGKPKTDHPLVDTSQILCGVDLTPTSSGDATPVPPADVQAPKICGRDKIEKLMRLESHLGNGDIALISGEPLELVVEVRRSMQ